MKNFLVSFLCMFIFLCSCDDGANVVKPTKNQVNWADSEIGVMFTFDLQVYVPEYQWRKWGTHPDPSVFNPTSLNTDQWIESAKKLGATYAVLVAKHCSGFSLWPTDVHGYSVKNCPWKDGKGDIVHDFIESCHKYGIKPALYASAPANGYFYVDNPGKVQEGAPVTQQQYKEIVEKQMTELWSRYGELFEVWFDGGILPIEEGGPDLWPILQKYQPNTIKFQGLKEFSDNIRWVGNEEGFAPDPCWATTSKETFEGDPEGLCWNPGEADFTLRWNSTVQGGWMWHADEDDKIFTVEQLMDKYEKSVGRNCNMLLGIVIDTAGLIPEGDVKRIEEFGCALKSKYETPVCCTSGKGNELSLKLDGNTSIDRIVIQEDITKGERVLKYNVKIDNNVVYTGTNIGHKRIVAIDRCTPKTITLEVVSSKARPVIKAFSAFK